MHLGGHSFSQIWHATQRSPFSQSAPSYTRKGKFRDASGKGSRSSGYSTVVSRSFDTKLPAKFFAVSARPFNMPSPSNDSSGKFIVLSSQFASSSDRNCELRTANYELHHRSTSPNTISTLPKIN